jgi:hypothetical protein
MQRPAHVLAQQHAPQPVNLVRWPKEWMVAVNGRVLALDHILDFPDRFAGDIPHPFDMLRNKHQPVRIDMPMFDKTTRLLRAAAGIARVHEAAMIVHETVQVAAGTRQGLARQAKRQLLRALRGLFLPPLRCGGSIPR